MKVKPLFLLAICTVFLHYQCKNESKDGQPRTFSPEPILKLIRYDRDAVEYINLLRPSEIEGVLFSRDSIKITELNLSAYIFKRGGGVGGPINRILCFCRDTGQVFQREFFYEGEYTMSMMAPGEGVTPGNHNSLGFQLSQLALELGPEIYADPQKMQLLMTTTMENLLKCPRIRPSMMDSLKTDTDFAHIHDYTLGDNFFKKKKECLENFEKIRAEMAEKDPNVGFFQGELQNGIWRGRILRLKNREQYFIDLDYINGECAFTIWM